MSLSIVHTNSGTLGTDLRLAGRAEMGLGKAVFRFETRERDNIPHHPYQEL